MYADSTYLQASDDDNGGEARPRKSKARKCLIISSVIFCVTLLVTAIIVLGMLLVKVGQQPVRVTTSCGVIEGKFDHTYNVFGFKGIPFAVPPTGKLRWQPTEPLTNKTCWNEVYYAYEFKSMCKQFDFSTNSEKGSEDCLYLNIFTPAVDSETPLPVMVYVHGGYLQWGDGATPGYSPDERLADSQNMVFVSIQYRLNAFGFLVSSALPGRLGNYGLLDQIEALRWVQQNIAQFGGDPNQVTLFGQSSGGTSVWALMMSPLGIGLFQRAWMISASAVLNKTLDDGIMENDWILREKSIADPCGENVTEKCLMELSASSVLGAIYPEWHIVITNSNDLPTKGLFQPALVVVDGYVIPDDPFEMWENGNSSLYSDVPVIIGSTAQEVDLTPTPGIDLKTWTSTDLANYVSTRLNTFSSNITNTSLALYPWNRDAEYIFTTMTSDLRCVCSNNILAERASEALTNNVYRYIITSFPSQPVNAFNLPFQAKYAFHGWDSYAYFWGFDLLFKNGLARSDTNFGHIVQEEMSHFARTGQPKNDNWLPYPKTTALLSDNVTFVKAYHEAECDFWMGNGFFSYSWIN